MDTVEAFKLENGCNQVFIDNTYSKPRYFPIYNQASVDFLKLIFEGSYSRFDDLILATLKTKAATVEELEKIYSNEIDFLD